MSCTNVFCTYVTVAYAESLSGLCILLGTFRVTSLLLLDDVTSGKMCERRPRALARVQIEQLGQWQLPQKRHQRKK